ncbi:hypothetical protein CONPUDRAFT_70280 [Coniophora puteana RWD-64-598 SS2]|uniref:Uncharacterized protein n=1 Tax=Coniophora puteana (strain RWD-64-598) TaxID=741705 RepID=A0A5M3N383_CONPW|nr:uncharacterized protein CONPUDRAFT_70280 [Coniophora puteana RWD-64-598 SS2]EIW85484.1 hypothetical protein CONPUDRAFT_70280 [Coniophora puteana RWD-64-598 SS2]
MDITFSFPDSGDCSPGDTCFAWTYVSSFATTIEEGGQGLGNNPSSTPGNGPQSTSVNISPTQSPSRRITASSPSPTPGTTVDPAPSPTSSHITPYTVITSTRASTSIVGANITTTSSPLAVKVPLVSTVSAGYITTIYSSSTTVVDSVSNIMVIVALVCVLLVIIGAVLVVRPYQRRNAQSVLAAGDTEALVASSSREEMREHSQNVQDTPSSEDHRADEIDPTTIFAFLPPSLDENIETHGELTTIGASPDHQPQTPNSCASASRTSSDDHHQSDLDSASFHTTRASSSRPNSLAPRPLPLIPGSSPRPGSNATICPGASLATEAQAEARLEEPNYSPREPNVISFQRETRTSLPYRTDIKPVAMAMVFVMDAHGYDELTD